MNYHAPAPDPVKDARFQTEVELLGGLLMQDSSAGYLAAAAIVERKHFSDDVLGRVFQAMGRGISEGLAGNRLTMWLISEFREDPPLVECNTTMAAMIAKFIARGCPAIGIEGSARQIRHDWLKEQLHEAVQDGDTASAEQIAAEMERLSKAHLTRDDGAQSIGDIARNAVTDLSRAFQEQSPGNNYARIGLNDMSRALGGWRRKRLYIIAGRPGMGKSTFALSNMIRTAQAGHGVMLFAQEMGKQELIEMAMCDLAWSPGRRIEYRDISQDAVLQDGFEDRFRAVYQVAPAFNSLPIMISDRGGLNINEIRSQALQFSQRLAAVGKRLDVVCVDHLGLMRAVSDYRGNKVAETEEISGALKQLAKELDCAVVALAQLSRQVESREDKRPNLSDLRWSGGIEQDADVVMFVYREAYYLSKPETDGDKETLRMDRLKHVQNKIEVLIEKNRGGPTRSLEFFCDMGCAVIRDLEGRRFG